jgi:hypothetical protein
VRRKRLSFNTIRKILEVWQINPQGVDIAYHKETDSGGGQELRFPYHQNRIFEERPMLYRGNVRELK